LKEQPGRAIYVVGGPSVVSSLVNAGLVDELRLIVHPLILAGGKSPLAGVTHPQRLELVRSDEGRSGRAVLVYRTLSG
jgi:dihydrofolate reductase